MHTLTLPSLLAMAGALAAQSGGDPDVAATELAFAAAWPEDGTTTFARVAAGCIGDDPLLDAVALRVRTQSEQVMATEAVYLQNPSRFDYTLPLGGPAVDVAVLPGAAGDRSGALVLHATGLALYTAPCASQVPVLRTDVQAPAWAGAQRLWVVTGAGGTPWVLAVDAAGTSLLRATWNGSAFAQMAPVGVPPGVEAIVALQWDGAGNRLLALLAGDYVFLCDFALNVVGYTPVSAGPPGGARNRIAVSRGLPGAGVPGPLRDLLVVYSHWFGSFHALVMNADVPAQWVALGNCAACDLVATDRNGDGLDDLALAEVGANSIRLLTRAPNAAPCFDPAGLPTRCGFESLPAGPVDLLVAGDFDSDGDQDLIGLQSASASPPRPATRVTLFDARVAGRPSAIEVVDYEPPGPGDDVHLEVEVGAPAALPPLGPGDQLRVRLEAWVCPNENFAGVVAERHTYLEREHTTLPLDLWIRQEEVPGFDPDTFVVHLHVHFVVVEAGGPVRRYGSSLHYFSGSFEIADPLHEQAMSERGLAGNPGGGDGNATGNTGGNGPPGDAQTP